MAALRLSRSLIADLTTVCGLPVDTLSKAASAIERLGTTIKRSVVRKALLESIGLEDPARALDRLLFALASAQRRGQGATPDIFADVRQGLEVDHSWDRKLLEPWDERRPYLARMLLSSSVLSAAKAVHLSYDFARLYLASRVITDIRPVFDEAREQVVGAAITQTLRLDYISSDGTESTVSVAMDVIDLRQLQKACQKALDKADIVRQLIEQQGNGLETIMPGEEEPK